MKSGHVSMQEVEFSLPDSAAIDGVIKAIEEKESHKLSAAFRDQGTQHPGQNWGFLEDVFSMSFRPGNALSPFGAMLITEDNRRSMIPDDLSEEQLAVLKARADQANIPEFQGRIYDVLWIRKKDFAAAEKAINAYIESGLALESPKHWVASLDRYERSIRLARTLGNKALFQKALDHLVSRVLFYRDNETGYFRLRSGNLLYEFKGGDPSVLADMAEEIAGKAVNQKNFLEASDYYELAAKFHHRGKNQDKHLNALKLVAEQKIAEAEARELGGSFMASHSFWNDAIQAYRKIPGSQDKIKELHRRLNIAGQKMQSEMQSFSHEIDVTELAKKVIASFDGLTVVEALCQFVITGEPIDPADHRVMCEKQIKDNPLQFTIDAHLYDAAGRKVGVRSSVYTNDPQEYEKAMVGVMNQQAHIVRHISVGGFLAPAMHKILQDHGIDQGVIEEVMQGSGFIPEGRIPIFAKAFRLGFEWDFSTALHLLIPQTENALRHLLAQKGVITTSLDHVGIEEAWPLGRILAEPKLEVILGKKLIFELKSLLTGDTGANYRNLLAHGLINDDYLNSHEAVYLWWILFRMTVLPTPAFKGYYEQVKIKNSQGIDGQPT